MHSVTSNAVAQGIANSLFGTIKANIYLRAGDNLNAVQDGVYHYENGDTPQNGYGYNAFVIQVSARSDLVFQFCYDYNNASIAIRHTSWGGTWSEWVVLHSGI